MSQILHLLRIDDPVGKLDEREISVMNEIWGDFYKTVLGPQRLWEDSIHPPDCAMFSCKHPWDPRCKTRAQEVAQWEDYAITRYKPPQVAGKSMDETLG